MPRDPVRPWFAPRRKLALRQYRSARRGCRLLDDDLFDVVVLVETRTVFETVRAGALASFEALMLILGQLLQEGACELVGG